MSRTNDEQQIIEASPFTRAEDAKTGRQWRLAPIPILVSSGFIVLALVVLFIFSARAVRFDISPQPNDIGLSLIHI